MNNQQKSELKNNSFNPPYLLRKSTLTIILIFIFVAIITLSGAVLFSPGCSPVFLELKLWGIEFQLEKGQCFFQSSQQ